MNVLLLYGTSNLVQIMIFGSFPGTSTAQIVLIYLMRFTNNIAAWFSYFKTLQNIASHSRSILAIEMLMLFEMLPPYWLTCWEKHLTFLSMWPIVSGFLCSWVGNNLRGSVLDFGVTLSSFLTLSYNSRKVL